MEGQNLFTKLNEVLDELKSLEKQYRKIYNNAVDIEDFEISQKTQSDAYLRIRKLKEWKSIVTDLYTKVSDSNIIEIIPSIEIDDEVSVTSEMIDATYDKLDKNNDTVKQNLEDNEKATTYDRSENTCKELISIKLFDKVYSLRHWSEVLIKVCEITLLKKPYIVARFDKEAILNSNKHINFSYLESEIKFNKNRLSNGLWIETNRSATDIVKVSKKILQLCGFDEKDLIVNFE
ncbi:MAG: hypothetical protein KAX49_17780 [Halanaerobiales bacterium]|nr:hypothetical protein [Halanaerobiales bacterium]